MVSWRSKIGRLEPGNRSIEARNRSVRARKLVGWYGVPFVNPYFPIINDPICYIQGYHFVLISKICAYFQGQCLKKRECAYF